jgi:hypothetical protein
MTLLAAYLAQGVRLPEHGGKNAEYWFAALSSETKSEREAAKSAIAAMDQSCLDFLISKLRTDVPTFEQRTRSWINTKVFRRFEYVGCGLGKASDHGLRLDRLAAAFSILGARAKPAIDRLRQLLSNEVCSWDAAFCLVSIGPAARPEIEAGMSSPDVVIRRNIAWVLGNTQIDKTNALRLALVALKDPDPLVRHYAAASVGELRVCPGQALPALTIALCDSDSRVRYISIYALKKFGNAALPALRSLQESPDVSLRLSAVEVIEELEALNLDSPVAGHDSPSMN